MKNLTTKLLLALAAALTMPLAQARNTGGGFEPITLYSAEQRSSTFASCSHLFPGNRPIDLASIDRKWKPRGLCSDSFAVLHSGLSKTPLVVVERLNRAQLIDARDEQRTDQFFPDPRLPAGERAHLTDYRGSGLDRGHLSAAANAPTARAMAQTFALTNMIPQAPQNNRRTWAKLESDTRKFALRAKGDVYVFSGPIFDPGHQTIGRNKVYVPSRLFKLVFDQASGRAWAHVLANTDEARAGAPVSYDEFVRLTGWRLLDGQRIAGSVAH